jgi:hypothetical protein
MTRETNRFYDEDAAIGLYGQAAMEEVFTRTLNMTPEQAHAEASERMARLGRDPGTGWSPLDAPPRHTDVEHTPDKP